MYQASAALNNLTTDIAHISYIADAMDTAVQRFMQVYGVPTVVFAYLRVRGIDVTAMLSLSPWLVQCLL